MTTPTVPTVDVPTLRAWLEDHRPLSLLDVRIVADVAFNEQPITATLAATIVFLEPVLTSPATFTEHTLAHLPRAPPNHQRIVAINEAGELPDGDHTELEAGANRCAVAS